MENIEQESEGRAPTEIPTEGGPKKSSGIGPIIGIIVIIILLALGGFYYFTTGINQIPSYEAGNESDAAVEALNTQSNSDTITDIEADLDATDLSEIDLLLEDIEADLESI